MYIKSVPMNKRVEIDMVNKWICGYLDILLYVFVTVCYRDDWIPHLFIENNLLFTSKGNLKQNT